MARAPRRPVPRGASRVGARFEAVVGPVAHGGHCVVRLGEPDRRVVFVRHALPGERVVLEITEGTEGDRFWRADAVEVINASPDRVGQPCPHARPGRCGGCDFQHVALPAQRELKASVVREQLSRLAGLDVPVVVEPVPGDEEGLRWRTRARFVDLPGGRRGMRKHRSRDVVEIDDCPITRRDAREVVEGGGDGAAAGRSPVLERVETVTGTREFEVDPDGFWQVHPGAPRVLVETVLDLLQPQPGERVLDLYAGVGLFARYLAEAVTTSGRVVAVEGARSAAERAAANLAGCPWAVSVRGDVERVLRTAHDEPFDLVVLDPPREGARRAVVEQVVARSPRAVAYVACDPAALARDVATFASAGYRMSRLRAFDLFPMTHHVECVALLTKTDSDLR